MPLLSITARFTSDNICKVQLSGGSIPTARMRLKMYAVHLKQAVVHLLRPIQLHRPYFC